MNDDLISRKMVLEKLKIFSDRKNGNEHFLFGIETAIEIIENEPVAFDKEKVIDQLKVLSSGIILNTNISDDYAEGYVRAAKDIIEIIEKGGIE